jgi:FtsP/CotA-like multicopper oxidase with cupredoxin domain
LHISNGQQLKRDAYPPGWNEPAGPAPKTGKTRYYDLTITRTDGSPDGVNKSLILINNQFPGPTIEANWGDTIQVKVTNKITGPAEGTTLHWHGFLQRGTPWADGTPGVSQCPIAPEDSFTYQFDATQYGTSWYHSHMEAQYMDGAFGAVVVHG